MATLEKHPIILVGVHSSFASERALDRALRMGARQPNAQVHVVSVGHPIGHPVGLVRLELAGGGRLPLIDAARELEGYVAFRCRQLAIAPAVLPRVATHVLVGRPAHALTQFVAELKPTLVILGTPGHRTLHGFHAGSLADIIRREARVRVLTILPVGASQPQLVPKIEPTCPACVEVRRRTRGEMKWCARHSERHGRRHIYRGGSAGEASFGGGLVIHASVPD